MGFFGRKKKKEPVANGVDHSAVAVVTKPAATQAPPPQVAPAPQEVAAPPSPESAAPNRNPLEALGAMCSLMMTAPAYKNANMEDLSTFVAPAIQSNQIGIAQVHDKNSGTQRPVAAVAWARVSPEVDQRLTAEAQFPPRLTAQEWTSGDIPWVVMSIGVAKACDATIAQISKGQLGGRPLKLGSVGADGVFVVREMAAAA